jgi:hypothetical protein
MSCDMGVRWGFKMSMQDDVIEAQTRHRHSHEHTSWMVLEITATRHPTFHNHPDLRPIQLRPLITYTETSNNASRPDVMAVDRRCLRLDPGNHCCPKKGCPSSGAGVRRSFLYRAELADEHCRSGYPVTEVTLGGEMGIRKNSVSGRATGLSIVRGRGVEKPRCRIASHQPMHASHAYRDMGHRRHRRGLPLEPAR